MRVGLLQALDDPQLLGSGGLEPRARQRELLRGVERDPWGHVVAGGRRGGKTTLSAAVLAWDACFRDHLRDKLRPGERRYSVGVAVNLRQARILLATARQLIESSPMLSALIEGGDQDELLLRNGSAIGAWPCTSRGGRGWPISALVMDEAAHFVDTDGNQSAGSVWRSLSPSLAQFGTDARAAVISSPWGDGGWFAERFHKAAGRSLPGWHAHHATSQQLNPTLSADFLADEQAADPEAFRSEYLAEFRAGGRQLLEGDLIREAVDAGIGERPPGDAILPTAAVDLAFARDASALVIVGRDRGDRDQLRQLCVRRWVPRSDQPLVFSDVLGEVAAVCKGYGAKQVALDQFSSAAAVEALRRAGLRPVERPTTAATRAAMFMGLRRRLSDGQLRLVDDPQLIAELGRIERGYGPGGVVSISLPRTGGGHCDSAVALALAVSEAAPRGRGRMRVSSTRRGQRQSPVAEQRMAAQLGLRIEQGPPR